MSDEEGKTRRNLMVFCSGVLAVTHLGIPLSGSTFLGLNLKDVDPFKAWVSAFIVLAYLTLRYWHDPTFQKQRVEWNKGEKEIRQKFSATLIRWAFRRRQSGGCWIPVAFTLPAPPAQGATSRLEGYIEFKSELTGAAKVIWTGGMDTFNGVQYTIAYTREDWTSFRIKLVPFIGIALMTTINMLRIRWILLEIAVPLGLAMFSGVYIAAMIYSARP